MIDSFTRNTDRHDKRKARVNSKQKNMRKDRTRTARELHDAIHSFRVN